MPRTFFQSIPLLQIADEQYDSLAPCVAMVRAMARNTNQSLYIIDYNRRNFLYVSPNPLFLCGYTPEQVQELGYAFYTQVVSDEELQMLLEINEAGFRFFYQCPVEERPEMTVEYDFHLRHPGEGRPQLIHHKLTPILLTPEGHIWLALCTVSLSLAQKAGNVRMTRHGARTHHTYSFLTRRWSEVANVTLTDREHDILSFSVRGLGNTEIGEQLFISADTVKFHKKKLFEKLQAENITEAVGIAAQLRLI